MRSGWAKVNQNNELPRFWKRRRALRSRKSGSSVTVTKIAPERTAWTAVSPFKVQYIFSLSEAAKTNLERLCQPRLVFNRYMFLISGLGSEMSLTEGTEEDLGSDLDRKANADLPAIPDFRFIPGELAAKSRRLIEGYHGIHGYGCLPDLLWHSDARDLIECNRELMQIFRSASKSRGAKRANESLLLVATVIFSVETLARDFAGWGKRFPAAKREAEKMLGDSAPRPNVWFMDGYLYPSRAARRELASEIAPSVAAP